MERIPCARCGRRWQESGRSLCRECYDQVCGQKPKCWECIYYLRDDFYGYCKKDGLCVVDGGKDACMRFAKP